MLRLNLTQHGERYQIRTQVGLTDRKLFLDFVYGGAWPLMVRGVICLVDSVNERDLGLSVTAMIVVGNGAFGYQLRSGLRTQRDYACFQCVENRANSRSVMLLDDLGCTRHTMITTASMAS